MKKEKFCFSKGTGLIALVGVVLVGLVLAMQMVGGASTSTSTRASFNGKSAAVKSNTVKKGGATNPGSRTFNELMSDAEKIIESNNTYTDEEKKNITKLKKEAENLFYGENYDGNSRRTSNRTIDKAYEAINDNIALSNLLISSKKGSKKPDHEDEGDAYIFYTAQIKQMKAAQARIIDLASHVYNKDEILILDRIPLMPDVKTLAVRADGSPIGTSKYDVSAYNNTNTIIKEINLQLDILAGAFAALDSALTRLLSPTPIPTSTPDTSSSSGETPTIAPTQESDQANSCKEDDGKFVPAGLGCDACNSRKTDLMSKAGLRSDYFAAFKMDSNNKLERACYAPFARAAKSGAAKASDGSKYICNNASCAICLNKEVESDNCNGIPVTCGGANLKSKLKVIPTEYPSKPSVLRTLKDYFASSNTQTVSGVSTCYLKNAGTFGGDEELASYNGQPRGYCADLSLNSQNYGSICACMSLINMGGEGVGNTKTCDDAVQQINTLISNLQD